MDMNKSKILRMLGGRATKAFPLGSVGLGQALTVVAGNRMYHMAGIWDKMTEEACRGVNKGAFAGTQYLEDYPAVDMKGIMMVALHRGAAHTQAPNST